jgi:hypothetical protein
MVRLDVDDLSDASSWNRRFDDEPHELGDVAVHHER